MLPIRTQPLRRKYFGLCFRIFSITGLFVASALAQTPTLFLDSLGVGSNLTVTGGGGPPSSSVELFQNGVSLGSVPTTAYGQFSFPGVTAATNDQFYVAVGQVWNFNTDGNTEGWNALSGDASVVSNGTWKQTNSTGTDMSVNLYGDGLIKTRARVLEVKLRFLGSGARTGSVIMQTAGPNGVAGGGDDRTSTIVNTFTLQSSTNFQTLVFDLGIDNSGAATCWLDGTPPINLSLYIPGTAIGDSVEIDYIRLTESLNWEFSTAGDLAEWSGNANTTLIATNAGTLRLKASASGSVAMSRPFRNIGSTYFTKLQTRLRQVTAQRPNLIQCNYFSNPSNYGTGGFQLAGTAADGSFQTYTINLTNAPTYGSAWTNGGGATMNFTQEGLQALYASAPGDYAEVDFVRLQPTVTYGPSATVVASGSAAAPSYYVSSSAGNDFNTGRDAAHPWATFTNLANLTLGQGATVYLNRGDTWTNSLLHLTGKGVPGNPITLTAYGEGSNPLITGINVTNAPCIQWEDPSSIRINSISCRDAKVGLYLRYYSSSDTAGTGPMFHNSDVQVTCCHFQNMNARWSAADGSITVPPPYELSWGAGIWIGGAIAAPDTNNWPSESTLILDGLTVTYCGFQDVSTGLGDNFYYPPIIYKSRFTNLRFEDSWVSGCENGSMALFYVNGGAAKRVDSYYGGTNFYASGTTAGFIQHSTNFTLTDCEFAYNKRNSTGNDGVGFDYEGNSDNIAFTNNVIHDNDGGGMLLLSTGGNNTAFVMNNNTFWNDCRNPSGSSQNYELITSAGNTGTFNNNGVYLGTASGVGTPGIYNNSSRWNAFTGTGTTRTGTTYASVSSRPTAWNFTSSVEGWGSANQWSGFGASGGMLVGTSSGTDPYAVSSATWVNTRERRWVYVRMSQTAGNFGQVFFQTETDPTFTAAKSVFFPIIADGVMHDYLVDMTQCTNYQGVITQWRLDPTDASGSVMFIDAFASEPNPYLATVTPVSASTLDIRFNQAMLPSGGVFSPANYTLSGAGQGTAASNPDTVSLIATTNGPVYRLNWHSGNMNGATATLIAANALNSRTIPLWSGSSVGFVNSFAQPVITSFSPASGKIGTSVVIQGTNFTGANSVLFNGVNAAFTVINNTQITATVPTLATTGPLVVWTPAGSTTTVSNFVVLPPSSDLIVVVTNTPNPVTVGSNVTSTVTVKNLGPDAAPTVMLTNTLPAGSALISATTTQGTLATNANIITASLGTLASNGTANVTLVFAPSAVGGIGVTAAAGSINADPNTANNTVTLPGFVEPLPLLSIELAAPNQVNIFWSGLLSNWVLQAKTDLVTNVSWFNVATPPNLVNGTNSVTETNSGTSRFYRLQR